MEEMARLRGARCGHGALAAMLAGTVAEACDLLAHPGWINLHMMREALWKRGLLLGEMGACRHAPMPFRGLALVQWLGDWPARFNCHHRHWLAWVHHVPAGADASYREIWDANAPDGWMPLHDWRDRLAPQIAPGRSNGLRLEWYQVATRA